MSDISVTTDSDGTMLVALGGRLDLEGTQELESRLAAHASTARGALIVDLSAVTFLASSGIHALLATARAVQQRQGRLVLMSAGPHVEATLRIAGVDTLVPLVADRSAARRALDT